MIIKSSRVRAFRVREDGTTLVEFAICIALFLLILFAVLDFGRLGYNWVMAEKAMQRTVRIAAVRPPICVGVPDYHSRSDPNDATFPAGTDCRDVAGLCFAAGPIQCTLSTADGSNPDAIAAAAEIWTSVQPLLPDNATNANVLLRYQYDPNLGFLGGPFVPLITAELVGPASNGSYGDFLFTFMTPLSSLAGAANAGDTSGIPSSGSTIPFPDVSVSLPAEDMNLGSRG